MRKIKYYFFLFSLLIITIISSDIKLGSGKTFEERLKEEDLDGYEEDHTMDNQMKDLIILIIMNFCFCFLTLKINKRICSRSRMETR